MSHLSVTCRSLAAAIFCVLAPLVAAASQPESGRAGASPANASPASASPIATSSGAGPSAAVADSVSEVFGATMVPLVGDDRVTVGAASTVIATAGAEVVARPTLSVALAVNE